VCRRESRPLVGKRPLVNVQPQIPVLHTRVAGYFSQALWWEKMTLMSAKRTQFSFPLSCSFPAVSSKSFIAAMYGLIYSSHLSANQGLYLALFHGANELNGIAEIIYRVNGSALLLLYDVYFHKWSPSCMAKCVVFQ